MYFNTYFSEYSKDYFSRNYIIKQQTDPNQTITILNLFL